MSTIIINTLAITVKSLENNVLCGEPVRGQPFYATSKEEFEKEFLFRYSKKDLLYHKIMKVVSDYYELQ